MNPFRPKKSFRFPVKSSTLLTGLYILGVCLLVRKLLTASPPATTGQTTRGGYDLERPLAKMETKEIAPGVNMPVISIGTGGLQRKHADTIVEHWLSLGGSGIDTAIGYKNLDQVRQSMAQTRREDVFVTTKIRDCNATIATSSIDKLLKSLGLSYLDLVLIHTPQRGDCLETWKILEKHYRSNLIRSIGVSNFAPAHLEPIIEGGSVVPHVNQIHLNLRARDATTIEFCEKHGISVQAYSPLGRDGQGIIDHPTVLQIAETYKVTPYQIALKWILQHGWILAFQSTSKEHQRIDADVFGFRLEDHDLAQLDLLSGKII